MASRRRSNGAPLPVPWRNRIVGTGTTTAAELKANPLNAKIHGRLQQNAMTAILDDVGWVGGVIVNRTTGLIVDGHMRVDLAHDRGPIPVQWVELTEDEEREVLALMDPIGALATYDANALARATEGLTTTVDMSQVLAGLIPDPEPESGANQEWVPLTPLKNAHVLVTIPLDRWDDASPLLDQLGEITGVTVASTVN